MPIPSIRRVAKPTDEQKKKGYRVEQTGENMLVWHNNTQVAFLCCSSNIGHEVQEVVGLCPKSNLLSVTLSVAKGLDGRDYQRFFVTPFLRMTFEARLGGREEEKAA